MSSTAKQEARKAGRPPLAMPEPISDTPQNVAKAILSTPPKKRGEWKFMQEDGKGCRRAAVQEGSKCGVKHGQPSA